MREARAQNISQKPWRTEAVCALDEDKISNEAFQNIRGIWEISVDLLREQAAALKNSEAEIAASLAQPVSSAETLAGDPLFARWGSAVAGEMGARLVKILA